MLLYNNILFIFMLSYAKVAKEKKYGERKKARFHERIKKTAKQRIAEISMFKLQGWAQLIVLISIPSCTISQRGLISRNFCTVATIFSMTKSISASVVKRPMPKRSDECAISSAAPTTRCEHTIHCVSCLD